MLSPIQSNKTFKQALKRKLSHEASSRLEIFTPREEKNSVDFYGCNKMTGQFCNILNPNCWKSPLLYFVLLDICLTICHNYG